MKVDNKGKLTTLLKRGITDSMTGTISM